MGVANANGCGQPLRMRSGLAGTEHVVKRGEEEDVSSL